MAHVTGYIKAEEVATNAAQSVGDPDAQIVRRPVYRALVRRALTLLCHDVPLDIRQFDTAIPEDQTVQAPKWMAGIQGVWVYNGERCNPVGAQEVYRKYTDGERFMKNQWGSTDDPMKVNHLYTTPGNLRHYAFNNREGKMVLWNCHGYEFIRITYAGLGFDAYCSDMELEIPMWAEQAITDWVTYHAAEIRQHEEGKYNIMQSVLNRKDKALTEPTGSWLKAMSYWGSLDGKDRSDTVLYISRMGYGGEFI
jgi:hypothetical protein